jgi:hypothetical protein
LARKKQQTWLEVAVRNGGFIKAGRAMKWAFFWAMAREDLGHDPTVDEVADWWYDSRRTAFRRQEAFRECFPMLESPALMFESEEAKAKLREMIAAGEELAEAIKGDKSAGDFSILQLGMAPATV